MSMTCVYCMSYNKSGTVAMEWLQLKIKFLLGFNMKIVRGGN